MFLHFFSFEYRGVSGIATYYMYSIFHDHIQNKKKTQEAQGPYHSPEQQISNITLIK